MLGLLMGENEVFGQLVLDRQDKLVTSFDFSERSEYVHCDFVIFATLSLGQGYGFRKES
jgi:hypothetical protein